MAVRNSNENRLPPPEYDEESNWITIKFYHGGTIRKYPIPAYVGGQVSIFDYVDVEGSTIDDMNELLKEIGINEEPRYFIAVEEHGFHEVISNREFENMCVDEVNGRREMEIYLLDQSDTTDVGPPKHYNDAEVFDDEYNSEDDETYVCSDRSDSENSYTKEWTDEESDYKSENEEEDQRVENVSSSTKEVVNVRVGQLQNQSPIIVPQILGEVRDARVMSSKYQAVLPNNDSDNEKGRDEAPDSESDFSSIHGSDDEKNKQIVFNPKEMWNPILTCGMLFSTFKEFKDAVRNWNIKRGRPFKFVKNDKKRVKAVCPIVTKRTKCDWEITARCTGTDGTVQIRSFKEKHKCGFRHKNKSVRSGWVARKYIETLRENPKLDTKSFRSRVMKENKCFLSRNQGYRAKRKALKIIHGSEFDQYSILHSYCEEILRTNPGSTVLMKMVDGYSDRITGQPRFERIYICFNGVKNGFLAGCRKLLGLDGTFLKGPCGGVLLTAVGIDPNNGLFPVAYAVAEGENADSWNWFLRILRDDLQIDRDEEWTLMSDKQKGLIQACECVFPRSNHRFCVKHLHGNWSTAGFKGKALRKALWDAAKATTQAQFLHKMEHIAALNVDAAKWLDLRPPSEWSRAHFKVDLKCDMLLNNHCESFNGKILEHRDQPIITMLEGVRLYMMERLQENRDRATAKWAEKAICHRIFDRVQKNCENACLCVPHKSNDDHIEVWCEYGERYAVNVQEKSCTCRKWDLTGIPCIHGISALWTVNEEPLDHVNDLYSVDTYLKCYSPCIFPLSGQHEWPESKELAPLPPLYNKAPGRPKKNRRRNEVEIRENKEKKKKVSRAGLKGKCTLCGEQGHNRRTCKGIQQSVDDDQLDDDQLDDLLFDDIQLDAIVGEDILTQPTSTISQASNNVERRSENPSQNQPEDAVVGFNEIHEMTDVAPVKRRRTDKVEAINSVEELVIQTAPPTKQMPRRRKVSVPQVANNVVTNEVTDAEQHMQAKQKGKAIKIEAVVEVSPPDDDSYKKKYEMFGLQPPPFPPGSKPLLKNVKKMQKQDQANTEAGRSVEGQRTLSKEYIAGLRSAYESMGINLPPTGYTSQLPGNQGIGSSVYERFAIPLPDFLGGNNPTSQPKGSVDASKSNTKADGKKKKLG